MLFDYEPTGGVVRMNCELLLFDMRKVFLTNEKLNIHIMKGTKHKDTKYLISDQTHDKINCSVDRVHKFSSSK